jgi:hypothetical protein
MHTVPLFLFELRSFLQLEQLRTLFRGEQLTWLQAK